MALRRATAEYGPPMKRRKGSKFETEMRERSGRRRLAVNGLLHPGLTTVIATAQTIEINLLKSTRPRRIVLLSYNKSDT